MPTSDEQTVEGDWRGARARFRHDRLLVSVRRGSGINRTLDSVQASLAHELEQVQVLRRSGRRWAVLQFTPPADAAERIPALASQLAARGDLSYAEPDFAGSGHRLPNDPLYPRQEWPRQVEIEWLWDRTVGASHVILAILDSGICMNEWSGVAHEDLHANRFITRHTLGGFTYTHNYVWTLFSPNLMPRDGRGHGTHVAGIAAATTDNHHGVAGANWESPVYIARVINDNDVVFVSDLKQAVDDLMRFVAGPWWSIFNFWTSKRLVINLSLGFQDYSDSLHEICEDTDNGRVMVCVAAKSLGASMTKIDHPASFAKTFRHVIAVGSVTSADVIDLPILADYSAITLFAPGVEILSTIPGYPTPLFPAAGVNKYARESGTSQACPIVAGAVSLVWSLNRHLRPQDIRAGLIGMAAQIPGAGGTYPRLRLRGFARFRPKWWSRIFPWW